MTAVTAWSRLDLVHGHRPPCDVEEHVTAYAWARFRSSYEGLAGADEEWADGWYKSMIGGYCYALTPWSQTFAAVNTSFLRYNLWREWLCVTVNGVRPQAVWSDPDGWPGMPFFDLIHFGDDEGTIGPVAAARIAAAFDDPVVWARIEAGGNDDQVDMCERMREAFRLAADRGLAKFK